MKPLVILVVGFFLSGFFFSVSSCRKDTTCKATVKCVDTSGTAIENAFVELYAPIKDGKNTYTADVTANGNTDASGNVGFVFKLPATYDVRATITRGTKTFTGTTILKLEEGKTVEKTVTVR